MLRLSLGLICLVLSVTVGHADNGADPLRALRKAAGENDPEAQYSLAMEILNNCRPTKEQKDEAIGWLRAAADRPGGSQPVAKAQLRLARLYDAGTYAGKDTDEALRWYRRAADNLVVEAMLRLADVHLPMNGAQSPESAEGVRWLQKAAQLGSPEAETWLGVLYARGQAVPRDYAEARTWFLRSAPVLLRGSCRLDRWDRSRFGNCLAAEYLGTIFCRRAGHAAERRGGALLVRSGLREIFALFGLFAGHDLRARKGRSRGYCQGARPLPCIGAKEFRPCAVPARPCVFARRWRPRRSDRGPQMVRARYWTATQGDLTARAGRPESRVEYRQRSGAIGSSWEAEYSSLRRCLCQSRRTLQDARSSGTCEGGGLNMDGWNRSS